MTQSHKSIGKKKQKKNGIRKPIGVCSLVYLLIISTSIYIQNRFSFMETVEDEDLLRGFFYSDVAAGRRKI